MGHLPPQCVAVAGGQRLSRIMSNHPTYLDIFSRTHQFILHQDGPLPYQYRHYIGIMAAGRHQCGYLIDEAKRHFLAEGGEEGWLKGLDHIPRKLFDLYQLNKILAHRPWLVDADHIQKLTKGVDSWSLAEVVHAIVLLAHFHSLSSFVFASGLDKSEEPPAAPLTQPTSSTSNKGSKEDGDAGVAVLVQRLKSLSEKEGESEAGESQQRDSQFEKVRCELTAPLRPPPAPPSIQHFILDPTFAYEDFAKRTQHIPTFRVQDYCWGDHAYSLVNRLYNEIGSLIDEKFKTAYNLTYYTMGGRKDIDTTKFRRAIWNYIHCVYGIRHDDYDYSEVNQLVERSLKSFIKTACCFPERLASSDYDTILNELKPSERVHVNIMILEARMQAELLYALRAVMRYMT